MNQQQTKQRKHKTGSGTKQQNKKKKHGSNKSSGKSNSNKGKKHSKGKKQGNGSNKDPTSFLKQALNQFATSVAAQNTSMLGDENDTTASGKAGEFDFYIFAQSWAPRFCCISPSKCAKENLKESNDVAVHGLWPAYTKPDKSERTYPAFCSTPTKGVHNRKNHEWDKHGTCSGLTREKYFFEEECLDSRLTRPKEFIKEYVEDAVPVDKLVEQFGGVSRVAIKTDPHCRLEEITTCWEKYPDGTVGKQQRCPDHVLASARNSAVVTYNCNLVWLDTAGSCKFIDKSFKQFLKTGHRKE